MSVVIKPTDTPIPTLDQMDDAVGDSDGQTINKRDSKSKASKTLQRGVQVAAVIIGLRIGLAVLKRTGRMLFGNGSNASKSSSKQQQAAAEAPTEAVPQVPPAAHWKPVDLPAPAIPTDYRSVVTLELPCSVYTFYHHVLSQQSDFMQRQHEQVDKQYNYVKRAWHPVPASLADYPNADDQNMLQPRNLTVFDFVYGAAPQAGCMRTITFVALPKPPNSVDTRCVQRQQLAVFQGGVLMFGTAMNMLNIPFKECFMVNTAWKVTPAPDGTRGCTLQISAKVHFVKGTLVSGLIRATTFRDLPNFYKAVTANMVTMLAAAPHIPDPTPGGAHAWGLRSLPSRNHSRTAPTSGLAAAHPAAAADAGQLLAQTMPLGRQLRVVFVMLVLFGSLLHQVLLHRELKALGLSLGRTPLSSLW